MRIRSRWIVPWLGILVLPSLSWAQRATTFEQLSVLIETGDRITVLDANGAEMTGTLATLSAHSLTMVSQGQTREWTDAEVSRILQRRQDSLANGALWGLVGGAAAAGTMVGVCTGVGLCEVDRAAVHAVGLYAAIGAGIGVGIDALITRRRVIYERPAQSATLSLAPILAGRRRGVALSLSF